MASLRQCCGLVRCKVVSFILLLLWLGLVLKLGQCLVLVTRLAYDFPTWS